MPTSSLDLILTEETRPGHFNLACGEVSYVIEFRPDTDVTLGDLLRRLRPVLVGRLDPARQLGPAALLQAVGVRLWQALLPEAAPLEKREKLAERLRSETTPLRLSLLPGFLAALVTAISGRQFCGRAAAYGGFGLSAGCAQRPD